MRERLLVENRSGVKIRVDLVFGIDARRALTGVCLQTGCRLLVRRGEVGDLAMVKVVASLGPDRRDSRYKRSCENVADLKGAQPCSAFEV